MSHVLLKAGILQAQIVCKQEYLANTSGPIPELEFASRDVTPVPHEKVAFTALLTGKREAKRLRCPPEPLSH